MTNDKYGYVAFYKGKRVEVYAASQYAALQEAAKLLRAKRASDVALVLAERPDGAPVVHSGAEV